MKNRESNSKRFENSDFTTAPYSTSTVLRMYSDFRDQAADVYGQMNGTALNVAVAYEDFLAGVHAMRTFGGLFGDAERQLNFDMCNAWKFDFLRIAELREAAIAETVRAYLIIVSIHAARELPATVKWWTVSPRWMNPSSPAKAPRLSANPAAIGARSPEERAFSRITS